MNLSDTTMAVIVIVGALLGMFACVTEGDPAAGFLAICAIITLVAKAKETDDESG